MAKNSILRVTISVTVALDVLTAVLMFGLVVVVVRTSVCTICGFSIKLGLCLIGVFID